MTIKLDSSTTMIKFNKHSLKSITIQRTTTTNGKMKKQDKRKREREWSWHKNENQMMMNMTNISINQRGVKIIRAACRGNGNCSALCAVAQQLHWYVWVCVGLWVWVSCNVVFIAGAFRALVNGTRFRYFNQRCEQFVKLFAYFMQFAATAAGHKITVDRPTDRPQQE